MIERPLRLERVALDPAFTLARRQLERRAACFTILGAADDAMRAHHHALGWTKRDPRTDPASRSAFRHRGATGTRPWISPPHDLADMAGAVHPALR